MDSSRSINIFMVAIIFLIVYALHKSGLFNKQSEKKVRFDLAKNTCHGPGCEPEGCRDYDPSDHEGIFANNEYTNRNIGLFDEGKWDRHTGEFQHGVWDQQYHEWRQGIDGSANPDFNIDTFYKDAVKERPYVGIAGDKLTEGMVAGDAVSDMPPNLGGYMDGKLVGHDPGANTNLKLYDPKVHKFYHNYSYKDPFNEYDEVHPFTSIGVKPYFDDQDPHPANYQVVTPYLAGLTLEREKIEDNEVVSKTNDLYYNLYQNANDWHITPKGKTDEQNRACDVVDNPPVWHREICHSHDRKAPRIPTVKSNRIWDIYDDLTTHRFHGDKKIPVQSEVNYEEVQNGMRAIKKDNWTYQDEHVINGGAITAGLYANDPFNDNNMALSLWSDGQIDYEEPSKWI